MEKIYVNFKEDEKGQKFYYQDFGSETHGKISFRLWVSSKLLTEDEKGKFFDIPLKNAKIEKTPKGNFVLKQGDGVVYDVYVRSGYRGGSSFEILSPKEFELFKYKIYHSQLGSLGVSSGALVYIPKIEPLKYKWTRTGRLYGAPSQGITVITPEGEFKEFDMLPDGLEALEELKQLEEDN